MTQLLVQKFLKTKSLLELRSEHGIDYRLCGHKVSLNYHQVEARNGDKIAEECRGLILRKMDGSEILPYEVLDQTKILCFGFKRFYNHGDPHAAKIDWNTAVAQEKCDGTLCQLYYDDIKNEWHVATRKVPEANLPIHGDGAYTFRELFEIALKETTNLSFEIFIQGLNPECTYIFELCTPLNRVVVTYENYKVFFLGMRTISSLEEHCSFYVEQYLPKPNTYPLSSFDDILSFVSGQNPLEMEGIVVCDGNFNRVKIKSPAYVMANRLHDTLPSSPKNCLVLALEEKADDILPICPDRAKDMLIRIQEKTREFIRFNDEHFLESFDTHNCDRYFADWVSVECAKDKRVWAAPMFQRFHGKASSVRDYLEKNKKNGKYKTTDLKTILEKIGEKNG